VGGGVEGGREGEVGGPDKSRVSKLLVAQAPIPEVARGGLTKAGWNASVSRDMVKRRGVSIGDTEGPRSLPFQTWPSCNFLQGRGVRDTHHSEHGVATTAGLVHLCLSDVAGGLPSGQ